MRLALRLALFLVLLPALARAQTDPRMVLDSWPTPQTWGVTHDDLLYQTQAHMKRENGADAQIFWWDSTGRFRLNADDPVLGGDSVSPLARRVRRIPEFPAPGWRSRRVS